MTAPMSIPTANELKIASDVKVYALVNVGEVLESTELLTGASPSLRANEARSITRLIICEASPG
jgi:hypothetical protein